MVDNQRDLKIIAEKPDLFGDLSDTMLASEKIAELRQIPLVAIGEITGVECIAPIINAMGKIETDAFVPTIAYTGTEYGSWQPLKQSLTVLKKVLEKKLRVYVVDPIILGSPAFWWALNGRFAKELQDRFDFYTPCLGCRLYAYALRVPLAKKINARLMISGQVQKRKNGEKVYQCYMAKYFYRTLLSNFGLELFDSVVSKDIADEIIESFSCKPKLVWGHNLHCVFEKNYHTIEGEFKEPPNIKKFFETFAIPSVAKILSRVLSGKRVDYVHTVADTLLPGEKLKTKKFSKKGFNT